MTRDTEPGAGSDEVVAWAQNGRLVVVGARGEVDTFVADLEPRRQLDLGGVRGLATRAASLRRPGVVEPVTRYVELGAHQWGRLVPTAATTSELRVVTRHVASGRFVANVPAGGAARIASLSQPHVLIALAAIQMALQSLTETVEEIARDVEDLKRLAETAEVGNLAGLYRVLANARAQVDRSGTITRTTWESVATHEVTAQQSADRVRAYLRRVLDDLPVEEDAGERLSSAERLVDQGTLRRSLRLLVLAEQNRLLWRSLKLDRVRVAEPEALESEADAATALLAENAEADRLLIEALSERIGRLGRLGPLDGARPWARHQLPEAARTLHGQVDEFATARSQQIESWAGTESPGLRDAAREIGTRVGKVATSGRRALGGWISGVGTWVQGSSDESGSTGSPERGEPGKRPTPPA